MSPPPPPPLSQPFNQLEAGADFDVIVIGSGYGGAIAASRLARAGRRVIVLERGKEYTRFPEDGGIPFPSTPGEALAALQFDLPGGAKIGPPTGLYDIRVNHDMNVVIGCGVGGTSLINAGVTIAADRVVWARDGWPQNLRDEPKDEGIPRSVTEGEQQAQLMLGSTRFPDDRSTPKLESLSRVAANAGPPLSRPRLNVTFVDTLHNAAGVPQSACRECGDCVSGCNHSAKNTVDMNYLPDAVRHGARIFSGARVTHLSRRADGRFEVHCQEVESGTVTTLTANFVMLGAGSLGSTEILLRSQRNGLALSPMVGQKFSSNGDMLGFAGNCHPPVHAIGLGGRPASALNKVGPTIQGLIDLRASDPRMMIEDAAIPGALEGLVALKLGFDSVLGDHFFDSLQIPPHNPLRAALLEQLLTRAKVLPAVLHQATQRRIDRLRSDARAMQRSIPAELMADARRDAALMREAAHRLTTDMGELIAASIAPLGGELHGIRGANSSEADQTLRDTEHTREALRLVFRSYDSLQGLVDGLGDLLSPLIDTFLRGALDGVMTYLVISEDAAAGTIKLDPTTDRVRIDWPSAGSQPFLQNIDTRLRSAATASGGTFLPNPIWSPLFHHALVSVHPLGGCRMADSAEHGVVNHLGQVFSAPGGTDAYDNLYVCDGAIIPMSLCVNPLLTISALAERICTLLAARNGWPLIR